MKDVARKGTPDEIKAREKPGRCIRCEWPSLIPNKELSEKTIKFLASLPCWKCGYHKEEKI
jgi:hypothetical protein